MNVLMSGISIIMLLASITLFALLVYALILAITALRIYIRKNR